MLLLQVALMKRGRFFTVFALALFMLLWTAGPTKGPSTVMPQDISLGNHAVPAASFYVKPIWDSIYSAVSVTNLQMIVRDISEDTPLRIWYPMHKEPSEPLADAWEYVNDTLKSYTSGNMHFSFRTQQKNLVAIKRGTDSNLAPIVIVGTVSSSYSPGANAYAASTAAVLEIARILYSRSLTNDVYFVLVNTITSGYGGNDGNLGVSELLDELQAEYRRPVVLFWLSLLLYESAEENGDMLAMRSSYSSSVYRQNEFVADIAEIASALSGDDCVMRHGTSGSLWVRSGAFEANERGIPAFVLSQYYLDGLAGGEFDEWDVGAYSYGLLEEAVGLVASLTTYLGTLGKGQVPRFEGLIIVPAFDSETIWMPLTGESPLQVDIEWAGGSSLTVDLVSPGGVTIISTTQSDNNITMSPVVTEAGQYELVITNTEMVSSFVSFSYEHWQDYDQDTLNDDEEYQLGTDCLNADTDMDLLDDDLEILIYLTDPLNPDTDSDGAMDGVEVIYGSHPRLRDTDGDGIIDGTEIDMGLDPTNRDTDMDGVDDGDELDLGLDPLSNDTDKDGLLDGIELLHGTDPFSPDTDSDGLSDLFEVVNGLNPLSNDTDMDGLSDSYEIAHCLMPYNADTDGDGIPDGTDWAPREHWINTVIPAGLGAIFLIVLIWMLNKKRIYGRIASP
jgi:hypothetical protein